MFALGIHYLNGWFMAAADGARKERAEWPPHPDRMFMALAAAWFETGQDPAEGDALRWLETLPAPRIAASDATFRTPAVSFVPVNDVALGRRPPVGSDLGKLRDAGLGQLPEHRSRQPRGFPVAIPRRPTVHMIWPETGPGTYREALDRLVAKVTHVGHSASFVQTWLDDNPPVPSWVPVNGAAPQRLRVTNPGRLAALEARMNRDAWDAYHDLRHEIEQAEADLRVMKHPPRVPWVGFPDVVLLANETRARQRPEYAAAKTGDDAVAATNLVLELVEERATAAVAAMIAAVGDDLKRPVLVSAHAWEQQLNAIPAALTRLLSERLGIQRETAIVQTNIVHHTGADGYGRLARQASFAGTVQADQRYIMVDDFVGQGGTFANLRGWIEKRGGRVVGAIALTGKPYSAKLNPSQEQLHELRERHGPDFEKWWKEHFGHAFDCLTQSEARYLSRSPDVDTIRNRLAAANQGGSGSGSGRSPRQQEQYANEMKMRLEDHFPGGEPVSLRPVPGRWQGYERPPEVDETATPGSVFDPRIVVVRIKGKRVSLPATLKLLTALRGILMKKCADQPPPEWFSGHRPDGRPSPEPHLALVPLPFVGAEHADGRIMGLGLVLPKGLEPSAAGHCLEPFLNEAATGLPREHILFDGQWFECAIEPETRERPPFNLQSATWTRESRVWASVTPVVLNRHFGGKDKWEQAAGSVKDACQHIGLPRPREVVLHPVSLVEGASHAREYPPLTHKNNGGTRSQTHAVLVFDTPVCGPVLVGAGRFRGYGFCRPIG
ncbi:MAG: type I-U CRISPR-associated protein Csb2 [Deltaproteobacteria bacterium]|nr:type I-U CRISPR-associated protein Csb2 [Deltaproteobacteria bacterium]